MLQGFQTRAVQIRELLQQPTSQFYLVQLARTQSFDEAVKFQGLLEELGYHLSALIFNRVYSGNVFSDQELLNFKKKLAKEYDAKTAEALVQNYKSFLPLIKRDQKCIKMFRKKFTQNDFATIPLFVSDVCDLKTLSQLTNSLILDT